MDYRNKGTSYNSNYKKLAVHWLNEVQFFNQIFMKVDNFVLRNPPLRQTVKLSKNLDNFVNILSLSASIKRVVIRIFKYEVYPRKRQRSD